MISRFGKPVLNCVLLKTIYLILSMTDRIFYSEPGMVVHEKGAHLNNCWEFIDGTVRSMSVLYV